MPVIATSYKQSYSWTENDFGPTEIVVVVSDAFEGLYAETLTAVNVIELDGIQQSIKGKNGGFEENELKMIISDLLIETVDDSDFVQFMKEAESNEVRRFIGVFFDDNTTTENLLFHGTAQREIEAEDLIWHGAHFNASPNPKRKLNFKVSPYRESVFGAFTVAELTDGRETPAIPGFDSTWESANVKDVQGYAYFNLSSTIFDVKVNKLVNINDVLRKYADNLEAAISVTGGGTVSIKFDIAELDGNWHPARWRRMTTSYGARKTRYVLNPSPSNTSSFDVYNDDFNRLKINPDGKPLTFATDAKGLPQNEATEAYLKESLFISYGMLKLLEGEPEKEPSKDFRFTQFKSFFELINAIALNFGLFARAYWATTQELRISFSSRNANIGETVYLKTSISGKLQPSSDQLDNVTYQGKANYKMVEGYDIHVKNNFANPTVWNASKAYENQKTSNVVQTLFTISPSVVWIADAIEMDLFLQGVGMPHNHIFYKNGVAQTGSWQETRGVHTAIYLYVDRYDALDVNESEQYYTPAAALSIKNGTEDLTFHRLADFLNYLYGFDYDAQFYEYTLELPGFHTLSLNSSGVSPIWKNHKLHNKLFLDNHWWKITQIKWKFATKSVELLLHSAQKYSFSNPVTPVLAPDSVVVEYSPPNIVANSGYQFILLNAAVTKLEVVARLSDGTYTKALPIAAHCQNLAGLALVDGITDEYIQIKTEGEISSDSLPDLPINTLMFLRKNDVGINISNIPLTVPTVDEHLYAIIGVYVGFKTIKIFEGFPKQWIFHPVPVEA